VHAVLKGATHRAYDPAPLSQGDGAAANPGNGTHVCFAAESEDQVKAFHRKALELGGDDEGKPGLRKEYSDNYYAAFARDLDGHKIEAVFFVPNKR
jgi:predicted lactoylglutathione lyase